jgi:hypothetical protein
LDYAMLRLALDAGAYPLCAVLFLAERGAEAEIASMPSEAVFPEIARRAHGGVDLMRIANLHAVIRRVRAYRLQAGAPDATADLIMKMMSQ